MDLRDCIFYSLFERAILTHSQDNLHNCQLCYRGRLGEMTGCCSKLSILPDNTFDHSGYT